MLHQIAFDLTRELRQLFQSKIPPGFIMCAPDADTVMAQISFQLFGALRGGSQFCVVRNLDFPQLGSQLFVVRNLDFPKLDLSFTFTRDGGRESYVIHERGFRPHSVANGWQPLCRCSLSSFF